jgi:16S rRNA (uracil1498-N3)-methyltransferase
MRLGSTPVPVGDSVLADRSLPPLTVAFAVLKGERNEMVVQKLTELGIDRIVPVLAERCVVRWDTVRAQRQHERLERVAREAAMQSRRAC